MAVIRLNTFAGENRAIHPKLLADPIGVVSLNQKPGRGDLRPWRQPTTVATIPAGRNTIYRLGRDSTNDAIYWHSWTGTVHVVRGYDATDTTERTYYSGDGVPKVINNLNLDGVDPQDNPITSRPLGLPAPAVKLTVTAGTGTSTTLVSNVYVYTYVNDYGWESAPSPPSNVLTRPQDAQATLSGIASPPAGNYVINRVRIYKSQSGSTSSDYFFLRELTVGTTSTTDDNRTLGEAIATTTWLPAPGVPPGTSITEANLTSLTALWNGMLAGITDNSVRFCEAYVPYAWPIAYDVQVPDSKPVGLGVFGQQLLVLTTGKPVLVAGSGPDSMDQQPMEFQQGCVSTRSIVSMGSGVAWASEDGLCWFGAGGAKVITEGVMLREDWQALKPSTIIGQMYERMYFGTYDDGTGRKAFIIDPYNPQGIYFLSTGYPALYFDTLRDQLYVLSTTNVQRWDAGSTFMTTTFRSKKFQAPRPTNFGVAEVIADTYPVAVRIYADDVLRHTQTVADKQPFRLPSGFMADYWQIEVETTGAVQAVHLGTSVAELAQT